MLDEMKNVKNKMMGKAAETAGKITKDQELEFSGKFQSLTSDVSKKVNTIKNEVLEEVNDTADKMKDANRCKKQ